MNEMMNLKISEKARSWNLFVKKNFFMKKFVHVVRPMSSQFGVWEKMVTTDRAKHEK